MVLFPVLFILAGLPLVIYSRKISEFVDWVSQGSGTYKRAPVHWLAKILGICWIYIGLALLFDLPLP